MGKNVFIASINGFRARHNSYETRNTSDIQYPAYFSTKMNEFDFSYVKHYILLLSSIHFQNRYEDDHSCCHALLFINNYDSSCFECEKLYTLQM